MVKRYWREILVYAVLVSVLALGAAWGQSRLVLQWDHGCSAGWTKGKVSQFEVSCPEGKSFEVVQGKEFIPGHRSTGNASLVIRDMECAVQSEGEATIVECRGLEARDGD